MATFFRGSIHASWYIAVASVGIVLGVVIVAMPGIILFNSIAWLLTGIGFIGLAIWRANFSYVCFALAGGLLIGVWRGSVTLDEVAVYDSFIHETVTLQGVVKEDVEINSRGQLVVRLEVHSINNKLSSGMIWMTTDNDGALERGDTIVSRAKLTPGFGSFNATAYSAQIAGVVKSSSADVGLQIRNWFASGVREVIDEPQVSLGLGYLLGQRRGLPEELDAALVAAGLTHVVVASGYNLTILVRLARRLFEKVSKYLAFISASGMILGFIAITGMSPSMSRAGLVAGLALLAWYYGRKFHPLVLLPFAMAVTLLINPAYAWGDLGWQLSFAAFGGVMIVAPLVQAYFFGDKKERTLRRILIETISAQISTLPIILVAFGQFSTIAPVANLLILPFVPLAMLLTFIAGIGGLILGEAGRIIGIPAELLLGYMTTSAQFMGDLPWAVQSMTIPFGVAVGMYIVIGAGCVYMAHRTKLSLAQTSLVE